jgi:AAA domain
MTDQAELFAPDTLGLSPRVAEARREQEITRAEARTDDNWEEFEGAEVPPLLPEVDGEQSDALAAIDGFLAGSRQSFCLHGLAGTGKTTVLARLARQQNNATLIAPTGKAASVLARKTGLPVLTMHKLLCTPEEDLEGNLIGWKRRWPSGALAGQIALVDEASMVGADLADDLLDTGIRIVAAGDPGQLPPVQQVPFFTHPNFMLQQIRRQAAGSPIIRQAHRVRSGLPYAGDGEAFRVIDRREAVTRIGWANVVLCWRNDTRHRMNRFIRERLGGYPYFAWPEPGEPLLHLQHLQHLSLRERAHKGELWRGPAPMCISQSFRATLQALQVWQRCLANPSRRRSFPERPRGPLG